MARSRLGSIVRGFLRQAAGPSGEPSGRPDLSAVAPVAAANPAAATAADPAAATVEYAPELDGEPDPGEVVWAWVAYEDDPDRGKDRPVLIIGRDGTTLLGLQLTSKDHDRDAGHEATYGRHWIDIGSGGWDREGRPSEVRLDRLLRMEDGDVRREGAALDREIFEAVVRAARSHHTLT